MAKKKKKKRLALSDRRGGKNSGQGSESRKWLWSFWRKERLTKKAGDAQGGAPTRQHTASSMTLMIINQKTMSGNEATFRQLEAADSWHYLHRPAMNYSAVLYNEAQRGCCGNQKNYTQMYLTYHDHTTIINWVTLANFSCNHPQFPPRQVRRPVIRGTQ